MDNKELISNEEEAFVLPGNPIDEMVFEALEFARSVLFLCARHEYGEEGEFGQFESFRLERIERMREALNNASREELADFKESSVIVGNGTYDHLNRLLFGISHMIPTIYSETNPEFPKFLDEMIFSDTEERAERKKLSDILSYQIDTDDLLCASDRGQNKLFAKIGGLIGRPLTEKDFDYIDSVIKHIKEGTYSKDSLLKEHVQKASKLF